jgi:hypothetical protein
MPDNITSPKPRHPLRPDQTLHTLDAPALDIAASIADNNGACDYALAAPAANPAMTPPTATASAAAASNPSSPPPVVLGKRAAHDMLPADGDPGADGPARMAKRPANETDRAEGAAEQRGAPAPAQAVGSAVRSLPAALDVLIKATESCRASLAQVKADRVSLGDESAASVDRLENGLRGLQEQGIAVVETYVRSIQAEADLFQPRPLQNGTNGLYGGEDAAHAPLTQTAPPSSTQASADLASDAAIAHRMWAYLDKCTMELDDGRRAWLVKYNAIKKQQEVYDKHVKSLHARQEYLHRMEDWLPRAEKVLAEGERECKRRVDEVHRQRQRITDQHREVETLKMNLMSWVRDEGAAYQRRFGAVHIENGGGQHMPPHPGGQIHFSTGMPSGSGGGGGKAKVVKGEMYIADPPFHVPHSPKIVHAHAPVYHPPQNHPPQHHPPQHHSPQHHSPQQHHLHHSNNNYGQSSKGAQAAGPGAPQPGGSLAPTLAEAAKKQPSPVVKLPKPPVVHMPDGMKAGPHGGKSTIDYLTLPPPSPVSMYHKVVSMGGPDAEVSHGSGFSSPPPPEYTPSGAEASFWTYYLFGSSRHKAPTPPVGLLFYLPLKRAARAVEPTAHWARVQGLGLHCTVSHHSPRTRYSLLCEILNMANVQLQFALQEPPSQPSPDDELYCSDLPCLDPASAPPEKEDAPAVPGPSGESPSSAAPSAPSKGGMAALTAAVATAAAEELAAETGAGEEKRPLPGNDEGGGGDDEAVEDDKIRDDDWTVLQKGKGKATDPE